MDASTTVDEQESSREGARRGLLGLFRRRSFLAGSAGLAGLLLVRPGRAAAVEPTTYGRGYRGGYR